MNALNGTQSKVCSNHWWILEDAHSIYWAVPVHRQENDENGWPQLMWLFASVVLPGPSRPFLLAQISSEPQTCIYILHETVITYFQQSCLHFIARHGHVVSSGWWVSTNAFRTSRAASTTHLRVEIHVSSWRNSSLDSPLCAFTFSVLKLVQLRLTLWLAELKLHSKIDLRHRTKSDRIKNSLSLWQ